MTRSASFFTRAILLVVLVAGLGCGAGNKQGTSTQVDETLPDSVVREALTLDFAAFDQDMTGGWRRYEQAGQPAAAAQLIDAYLREAPELVPWQRVLLSFHAGQMYAYANVVDSAVLRFRASADSDWTGPGWLPYVRATVAFLERDSIALERAYAELLKSTPDPDGTISNLDVVERLRAHLGGSYAEAYEPPRQ